MEFISDAVAFDRPGWRMPTSSTAANDLHVLYRQDDEVVCLGVETATGAPLPAPALEAVLAAIEARLGDGGFAGDYGVAAQPAGRFDALGHLSGDLRRLADGWANPVDRRVVQVFPCFRCELDAGWRLPKFVAAVRGMRNLFDLDRAPSPFLEITLHGRAFPRPIDNWAGAPLTLALSYASALTHDPTGVLRVRNLQGAVLTLDKATPWAAWAEAITAHAQMR
ncbi:hypothetical protein ACO2Q3_26360 [Caulobacter sp. KR2-114]|uniref:hypothetical protein n=1 Tax=Caulobacter sp. KR2-114 TaxID=3400912 RepID=UPI003BFDAA30